jgi:hypothetical protein
MSHPMSKHQLYTTTGFLVIFVIALAVDVVPELSCPKLVRDGVLFTGCLGLSFMLGMCFAFQDRGQK